MKIISFPHYTCGGLLCDILNKTFSRVAANGGINGIQHSIGKIGDSDSLLTEFDAQKLLEKFKSADPKIWIGTHCWLGDTQIDKDWQVINITTSTYKSRLYRWVRAWHHYYIKSKPWQNLTGLAEIDKQRETAKNYLSAFNFIHRPGFTNLEFADVVECNAAFRALAGGEVDHHMERWKQVNYFLYQDDVWTGPAARRFYEAEFEMTTQQRYICE